MTPGVFSGEHKCSERVRTRQMFPRCATHGCGLAENGSPCRLPPAPVIWQQMAADCSLRRPQQPLAVQGPRSPLTASAESAAAHTPQVKTAAWRRQPAGAVIAPPLRTAA